MFLPAPPALLQVTPHTAELLVHLPALDLLLRVRGQLSAILFLQFLQIQLWQLFSDAESAHTSTLDADEFTDVTLAKATLLIHQLTYLH